MRILEHAVIAEERIEAQPRVHHLAPPHATDVDRVVDRVLEAVPSGDLEVDVRRASIVAEMMMSAGGYIDVRVIPDLTGRERFVFASRA